METQSLKIALSSAEINFKIKQTKHQKSVLLSPNITIKQYRRTKNWLLFTFNPLLTYQSLQLFCQELGEGGNKDWIVSTIFYVLFEFLCMTYVCDSDAADD